MNYYFVTVADNRQAKLCYLHRFVLFLPIPFHLYLSLPQYVLTVIVINNTIQATVLVVYCQFPCLSAPELWGRGRRENKVGDSGNKFEAPGLPNHSQVSKSTCSAASYKSDIFINLNFRFILRTVFEGERLLSEKRCLCFSRI
jgi:hypothetical protein